MEEEYDIMVPPGNTVDDLIDGEIIVRSNENIMIQLADSSPFLLVELLFKSSRETIVRIDFADKPSKTEAVS